MWHVIRHFLEECVQSVYTGDRLHAWLLLSSETKFCPDAQDLQPLQNECLSGLLIDQAGICAARYDDSAGQSGGLRRVHTATILARTRGDLVLMALGFPAKRSLHLSLPRTKVLVA